MTHILEARDLRKRFGTVTAVDGVSFGLAPGEILGLLGPNGAGKTTTVSMLSGLLAPDDGEVLLNGAPLAAGNSSAKRTLGLVPQDLALYDNLTAEANLRLFGALYGLGGAGLSAAVRDGLAFVGLSDRAGHKVKTFSGGMKRRLNLAAGLLHDPAVLLLDEPTVGVDPQSRNAIFTMLEALKARGKAILYTTHYMEEAERLCGRIVIVDHGKVLADGTPAALAESLPTPVRIEADLLGEPDDPAWLESISALDGISEVSLEGGRLTATLDDLAGGAGLLLAHLKERDVVVSQMKSERPDLETVFLALTGRELRDA